MRTTCFAIALSVASLVNADSRRFPYEAVVRERNVYARSGPGEQFFPTQQLKTGSRVEVHRHDPGGWLMIAPPEGSFSLIPADKVERTGPDTVEVTQAQVVAYVGSDFGPEASVFQRRISPGEPLFVIGESDVATGDGTQKMLRIRPPQREWRWVSGDSVVAKHEESLTGPTESATTKRYENLFPSTDDRPDPYQRQQNQVVDVPAFPGSPEDDDPFAKVAATPSPRDSVRTAEPERHNFVPLESVHQNGNHRRELDRLDAEFKMMVLADKSTWNFKDLESNYRHLQNTVPAGLRSEIAMRLAAVDRYRTEKLRYDEVMAIAARTDRREAELLGMTVDRNSEPIGTVAARDSSQPIPLIGKANPADKSAIKQVAGSGSEFEPARPAGTNHQALAAQHPAPMAAPSAISAPLAARPAPVHPGTTAAPQALPKQPPRQHHKNFVGAGIVQVSNAPGRPQFVLVSRQGQLLSYIVPAANIDLRQFVGRSVGLLGTRMPRPDLQADLIEVRGMLPVRLRK